MLPTACDGSDSAEAAWGALLRRAEHAADVGAETFCVPDHLDYPAGSHNLECWTVVTALASLVPGVDLLPLVMSAPLRPPGLAAAMARTLEAAAPGRVRVGVGAGVDEGEHVEAGASFGSPRERVAQVKATVVALGKRCPSVPVVVAGGGDQMLEVAAQHAQEWNCGMMLADRRIDRMTELDRLCERSGRRLRRSVLVAVLGGPPPDGPLARRYNLHLALRGRTPEELVEEVEAVTAEGFDAVYLSPRNALAWDNTFTLISNAR